MLLWKLLVEDARRRQIDAQLARAAEWIYLHLRHLFIVQRDEDGQPIVTPLFEWEVEWPKWQERFRALLWLARTRAKPPKARSAEDRIPLWVERVVEETVGKTRNAVMADHASEARITLQLTPGHFHTNGQFGDLDEFWQAAFVTFFQPEALAQGSVCAECGKALGHTGKGRRPSRARLCSACRVKKWRREHPNEAREMWRRAKQPKPKPKKSGR